MAQRHERDVPQFRIADRRLVVQTRQRPRSADKRQFAAQSVGPQGEAEPRRGLDRSVGRRDRGQTGSRRDNALAKLALLARPCLQEGAAIALEGVPPLDDLDSGRQVRRRSHVDRQSETIEELRPQLALFGIAAADQHEAGRVAHAEPLALDDVDAGSGDVQQQIDEMILEQIDLVDVQEPAVGLREQSRLERFFAARERTLQIKRADDPVLGRAQRQIDHRDRPREGLDCAAGGVGPAAHAKAGGRRWFATVRASDDGAHLGQKVGERTNGGGFSRSAIPEHQNAADGWIDGGDEEGQLHVLLANDRGKGKLPRLIWPRPSGRPGWAAIVKTLQRPLIPSCEGRSNDLRRVRHVYPLPVSPRLSTLWNR